MKIAIDISPLSNNNKIRGVGFYLLHLKNALEQFFPENTYLYFTRSQKIPNSTEVIHYPYFEPFFLSLSFLHKKKTVVTVHDLTPLVLSSLFPVGIKGKIKWHMQRLALRNVSAVITDSESSKKDISRLTGIPLRKITRVYLAAAEHFRVLTNKTYVKEIRKKYNLPEGFALSVGDVTPNKNLPRLVKASLKADIPLVMVGKSLTDTSTATKSAWLSDLKTVREISEKNSSRVILLGFVSDEELVALYNMATVFIMPSLYEGFGLPILEAMSCGCPVIVSREGSLGEVAGDAAYFVDAYSVESIASGLEKVINDRELQKKLSKKGLEQVKKFSWKKTAEETVSVYKSLR